MKRISVRDFGAFETNGFGSGKQRSGYRFQITYRKKVRLLHIEGQTFFRISEKVRFLHIEVQTYFRISENWFGVGEVWATNPDNTHKSDSDACAFQRLVAELPLGPAGCPLQAGPRPPGPFLRA